MGPAEVRPERLMALVCLVSRALGVLSWMRWEGTFTDDVERPAASCVEAATATKQSGERSSAGSSSDSSASPSDTEHIERGEQRQSIYLAFVPAATTTTTAIAIRTQHQPILATSTSAAARPAAAAAAAADNGSTPTATAAAAASPVTTSTIHAHRRAECNL